jgi:microcystin-dependent protein
MPSVNSANKNYELMATGENQGTWGIKTNSNLSVIDLNFGGRLTLNVGGSSNVTISTSQAQNLYHRLTGTLTGNIAYIVPTQGSTYVVRNDTSGAFFVTVRMASGTGVIVPQGHTAMLFADPSQSAVVPVLTAPGGPMNMGAFGISNLGDPVSPNDASTKLYVDDTNLFLQGLINDIVPVGIILDYGGVTGVPGAGKWALCYGQAISRSSYPTLFSRLGTTFGAGNGTTTFNLPDYRGRLGIGIDNMGGASAGRITTAGSSIDGNVAGATGGNQSVGLSIANMPPHNHGGSTGAVGDHTHSYQPPSPIPTTLNIGAGLNAIVAGSGTTGAAGAHSHSIAAQGSGTGHLNVQPSIMVQKMIRIL